MSLSRITPVHRPGVPASLRDDAFAVGHLDDAQTLAALGQPDVATAAAFYRDRFGRAAAQDLCRDLLATQADTDPAELEEIARNVLTLRAHMHVRHDYGPRIDWTTVLDGDIESNVAINHHAHIAALALAYHRGGPERYAAHAAAMLRSWFEQSPAPRDEARLQWRTLEVGGRLTQAWPVLAVCLFDYPGFTDRDLFDLVRWTWLSVRHLRRFVGPPSNWLQIESMGALCALAMLGEIPAAAGWGDLFTQRLEWINEHQFLPDGMQAEDSPGYHVFPWWRLYSGGVWIELFGDALPPRFWQEQLLRAHPLWMLRQSDGTLPMLSDCSPQPSRPDRLLAFVRRHQPAVRLPDPNEPARRDDLSPDQRICHLPYAGYTACRTSWEPDAEFLLFDHGFYGTNHQHEDKLTFVYAAGGRTLVGDAGIYRYSQDAWEHYFRGAPAHNVIAVDGKQQCRSLRAWQGRCESLPDPDSRYRVHPGGEVVLAGAYRDGFAQRRHHLWDHADRSDELATLDETVEHQRLLVWLPGRGLLVLDRLAGQGAHQVDQTFHLLPCQVTADPPAYSPGRLELAESVACHLPLNGQPGVLLIASDPRFAWSAYCGQEDPPRGWTSLYGQQPSHDLWRSGRVALPVVLGTWIQPWRQPKRPEQAGLQLHTEGVRVEFSIQVTSSSAIHGETDFTDLGLQLA